MANDKTFKQIFPVLKNQFKSIDMRGIFAFSRDEGFWRIAFLKLYFTKLETSELKRIHNKIIDIYKIVNHTDFGIFFEARKIEDADCILKDIQNLHVKMSNLDAQPMDTNYQNIFLNNSFVNDYPIYTYVDEIESYSMKALASKSSFKPIDVITHCKINLEKYRIDFPDLIYPLAINDINQNSDLLIVLPIYCKKLDNDLKEYIAKFEIHKNLTHDSDVTLTLKDDTGKLLENSGVIDIETLIQNSEQEMNILYLPKFQKPIENSHKISVHISHKDMGDLFNKTITGSDISRDKSLNYDNIEDYSVRPIESNNLKLPYHPKKIFIVHGHDKEAKLELKIMLRDFGLTPIILDERPDKGRTIIEKFEEEISDIGYAFILLTPDDKITISTDNDETDQPNTKKINRARQNVVFEMGFFMGRRGRKRVCCIYKGVEKPSDIEGIVYKPYDDSINELYRSIRNELKTAGYQITENE